MSCFNVPDLGQLPPLELRPAIFHPGARAEIQEMPKSVRFELGKALLALQYGYTLSMPRSRPMPIVAPGVEELRIGDASGQYRAFYLKKAARGILVLHAFMKKTQQTPRAAIVLAQRRLKELET